MLSDVIFMRRYQMLVMTDATVTEHRASCWLDYNDF